MKFHCFWQTYLTKIVKPEAPDGAKNLCTISTVYFSNEIFQDRNVFEITVYYQQKKFVVNVKTGHTTWQYIKTFDALFKIDYI